MEQVHHLDIQQSNGQQPVIGSVPNTLMCSSDQAKALAIQVISKNPPDDLLNTAGVEHFATHEFESNQAACDKSYADAKAVRQACWDKAGVVLDDTGNPHCSM